jgi:hypothetical protein
MQTSPLCRLMAAPSPWVENVKEEVPCAQLTHRIIPAGDSHESASSQVTGPSRVQRSGLRNNPRIGVIPVGVLGVGVAEIAAHPGGIAGRRRRRWSRPALRPMRRRRRSRPPRPGTWPGWSLRACLPPGWDGAGAARPPSERPRSRDRCAAPRPLSQGGPRDPEAMSLTQDIYRDFPTLPWRRLVSRPAWDRRARRGPRAAVPAAPR